MSQCHNVTMSYTFCMLYVFNCFHIVCFVLCFTVYTVYVLYDSRGTSEVEALSGLKPCPPSRGSRGDASENAQVGEKLRIQCLQMQTFLHSFYS